MSRKPSEYCSKGHHLVGSNVYTREKISKRTGLTYIKRDCAVCNRERNARIYAEHKDYIIKKRKDKKTELPLNNTQRRALIITAQILDLENEKSLAPAFLRSEYDLKIKELTDQLK